MDTYAERAAEVVRRVGQVLFGKEAEIREVLLAILANGHILLEDIPGVGKTTLAMAFSRTLDLEYRRVQFTPDVLPSDLTGLPDDFRRCWRTNSTAHPRKRSRRYWRPCRKDR